MAQKLFKTEAEYKAWEKKLAKDHQLTIRVSDGVMKLYVKDYDGWEDEYIIRIKELEEERIRRDWGGARPGAGRKKGKETVPFGCRLKVETKQFLQDQAAAAGITVTEALETIIQIFRDEHK